MLTETHYLRDVDRPPALGLDLDLDRDLDLDLDVITLVRVRVEVDKASRSRRSRSRIFGSSSSRYRRLSSTSSIVLRTADAIRADASDGMQSTANRVSASASRSADSAIRT